MQQASPYTTEPCTGLHWSHYLKGHELNSWPAALASCLHQLAQWGMMVWTVNDCDLCPVTVLDTDGLLTIVVTSPTQFSISPRSVNNYHFQLGRQRQVWFIPFMDEHHWSLTRLDYSNAILAGLPSHGCAGKNAWSLDNACRTRVLLRRGFLMKRCCNMCITLTLQHRANEYITCWCWNTS